MEILESDEASNHFKNNKSVYEELVNARIVIRKDFHTEFQNFQNLISQNQQTICWRSFV
jgi:hypothetical protein